MKASAFSWQSYGVGDMAGMLRGVGCAGAVLEEGEVMMGVPYVSEIKVRSNNPTVPLS